MVLVDVANIQRDLLNAFIKFTEALSTVSLLPLVYCPNIVLFIGEALLTVYPFHGGPCHVIFVKHALLYASCVLFT